MRSKNQPTRTQQARRQDILEATIHLVATQGYAATATSAIAEAANTSKGTVLYHFGSKQALDAAVVDALFRAGRDAMGTSMAAASTPGQALHSYLESNLRFIADNVEHVIAVHRILQNTDVANPEDPAPDAAVELGGLLRRGQKDGTFNTFDPDVTAQILRGVIDMTSYQVTALHAEGATQADLERHLQETVRFCERAVGMEPK